MQKKKNGVLVISAGGDISSVMKTTLIIMMQIMHM
jgi:hypothetical protein